MQARFAAGDGVKGLCLLAPVVSISLLSLIMDRFYVTASSPRLLSMTKCDKICAQELVGSLGPFELNFPTPESRATSILACFAERGIFQVDAGFGSLDTGSISNTSS